jgi:NADH-quinone oxidoreductase subunit G
VVKVKVNEVEVEVDAQDNCILAARRAGVEIPHYCWHESLSVVASCRMCLVEVGETKPDGTVVMGPKLVPGCQTPIKEGTVIRTDSPKVKTSQQMTLELLLLNHPLDCSICDQAGECYLQDYTYKFGKAHSRLDEPKLQRMDKYHIGEQIALFTDRCVMCTRCVRFTREISGTAELQVVARGSQEEIDVFPDQPCNNKLAGNVVDLCPVGALCSKDFLYKKRVWWLKHAESVCAGCSTGCSIYIDQNENQVYRLRPRENPQAQGHFMCDEGRFGFKYVHDEQRLKTPRVGSTTSTSGASSPSTVPVSGTSFVDPWPIAIEESRQRIQSSVKKKPENFIAVFSPYMTVEEAYLLASFVKALSPRTKLVLGPVPVVGEDDRYPKGPHGEPPAADKVKFTIRAEKCPNRIGVEIILRHFEGKVNGLESLTNADGAAWYVVGGYSFDWASESVCRIISNPSLLIVQDILPSALSERADIVLPSASFAEREGTFINHGKLAQSLRASIRPPGEARIDGRLLMELAGRKGLFNAAELRKEIGKKIWELSALAEGELGPHGVPLEQAAKQTARKVNQPT